MRCGLWMLDEVGEDVFALTIGDNHANASLRYLARCGVFRVHTTTSESTLLRLDVLDEVTAWCHFLDELGCWVVRMTIEDTIDVRQQDQCVCLHHLGDEA